MAENPLLTLALILCVALSLGILARAALDVWRHARDIDRQD